MVLKGNHATLHDDGRRFLDDPHPSRPTRKGVQVTGGSRPGRPRSQPISAGCRIYTNGRTPRRSAKCIASAERADKTTPETTCYLLSDILSPARFGEIVRAPWGIENRRLWRLNVTLSGSGAQQNDPPGRPIWPSCNTGPLPSCARNPQRDRGPKSSRRAALNDNALAKTLAQIGHAMALHAWSARRALPASPPWCVVLLRPGWCYRHCLKALRHQRDV
jgi:hypothetical protein